MALTGKFIADFANFYDAVAKAQVSLKSFEGEANKVGSSLNKMADSLSGKKLIQDATLMASAVEKIGGPAKLTASELQRVSTQAGEAVAKMKALGIEVPPKIQNLANQVQPLPSTFSRISSAVTALGGALGIAFTGAAILNGIKNQVSAAMTYADALTRLKDKTELSYRDLQILEDVGISSGVSIETLAGAVQILQMRLGDGSARKGLQALKLSFHEIKDLAPAEQFAQISSAIAKIQDPTERASVASQVFGRSWKELLPALKANMAEAAKSATLVGDAQLAAADRGGDRWEKFWNDQKRGWASWAGDIILNMERGSKSFDEASRRAAQIRGASNLPTLPTAPTPRLGLGAFVNDVDPEMISRLQVYGKTLEDTSRATAQVSVATRLASDARAKFLEMSKAGLGSEFDWQRQIDLTKWSMTQLRVEETALYDQTRTLAEFVAEHKGEMFPEPPQGSLDKWIQGQQVIHEMPPKVNNLREHLGTLSEAFAQLAQIGGGALGGLTRGIGTLITAARIGLDSISSLKDGFKSLGSGDTLKGLAGLATGIGGIIGIAQTAIGVIKKLWSWARGGEEGTVVNPAREAWFSGRSVQDIGDQLAPFMSGEEARKMIERVFNARTKSDFEAASSSIDAILAGKNSFAHGTGGKYLDFGSGTLAMLHGKEKITPAGAADTRPLVVQVMLEGREIAWALVPHLPDAIHARA